MRLSERLPGVPRRGDTAEGYAVSSKVALGYARRSAMYAVVRRYEGVTDPAEAGHRVDEGFVPLLRQVPGFVAYYWIDAGDGVMVSTSIYEDQAGADESVKRAADFVRDNLAPLLPNPPQVTAGQVVATG
ncbi:hypothetical protein ABZ642_34165 [Streptomyces sp. NPDC007157]|uniref:hypothetical protein n=1 Tax=Streptomyces sp. NPDC007157 TaxID=3154681 RepID=UPI0033F3057A